VAVWERDVADWLLARLFVLKKKMVWESQRRIWMKNQRWIYLIL
jgi:hypothetical protein